MIVQIGPNLVEQLRQFGDTVVCLGIIAREGSKEKSVAVTSGDFDLLQLGVKDTCSLVVVRANYAALTVQETCLQSETAERFVWLVIVDHHSKGRAALVIGRQETANKVEIFLTAFINGHGASLSLESNELLTVLTVGRFGQLP